LKIHEKIAGRTKCPRGPHAAPGRVFETPALEE